MSINVAVNSLLFVAALFNAAIGMLVYLRNNKQRINQLFLFFSIGVAGWASTNVFFQIVADKNTKYVTALLSYGFASLLSVYFYLFSEVLVGRVRSKALFRRLFLWYGTIMGVLSVLPGVIATGITGKSQIITHIPFLIAYGISLILTLGGGFFILLFALGHLHSQERRRIEVILLSFSGALAIGVACNLILPVYGVYSYVAVGPLGSLILMVGTAYAIARHRLFDIRAIIARVIAYLVSILLLAALYSLGVFSIVRFVFNVHIPIGAQITISVATALAALSFNKVKLFFDRITNRYFYQDAYDSQQLFNELNQVLVAKTELEDLLVSAVMVIEKYLKSSSTTVIVNPVNKESLRMIGTTTWHIKASLLSRPQFQHELTAEGLIVTDALGQNDQQLIHMMNQESIAILARLGVRDSSPDDHLGYLVFGPKRSGSPYSDQDIRAVRTIADGLVIAIQNALRFEEIENFNTTLQQKVDDATRKLRRTNDKLRQLDETKDDFISMASHQLRTPLTSVKGYVSMVLDGDGGKLSPLQRKLLNQSFISAQRMVYLISDLLNVSRLRTGRFIVEPVPTNLANVVQEEVRQLVETAKGRNLELSFERPEHFPALMLDETKIRQVIMNFIDNAIYYTPSGGHIVVRLQDKAQSVELTVNDDGIGVPRGEQHHLFSKFYRADNAKRARPDGTGLGLFMAKKVIAVQGGAIIFRSAEGKGSTFGFTFAKAPLLVLNPEDKK